MTGAVESSLTLARALHAREPDLRGFCDFPDAFNSAEVTPYPIPAAERFVADEKLQAPAPYAAFTQALRDLTPLMKWRETYRGTPLFEEFDQRFACYELLGPDGPHNCQGMRGFMVYMEADLWYPFHHHPSEEMYFILAGEAAFRMGDDPPRTLRAGDTVYHPSNVPHATQTYDHPLLVWVLWRGPDFETPPVLTDRMTQ